MLLAIELGIPIWPNTAKPEGHKQAHTYIKYRDDTGEQ